MKHRSYLTLIDISDENEGFYGLVIHFDEKKSQDNYQFIISGHDSNQTPYNVTLTMPKLNGAVKATGTYQYQKGNVSTNLDIIGINTISNNKICFDGTFFETYHGAEAGYGKIKLRYEK